jgi:tRNA A-37 threonylcarbamoyl transferase component Bud32/tetratricopeptide (TPR) repeat protein
VAELNDSLQAALGSAYRLERELGGGGMSRVYVATELALGRKVVVKVLPPEMGAGLNAERFRREIQLAASLQHPHVVPLLAAGRSADLVWYTMPLIEGESLRAKIAREGELPIAEAVRILRDVADSLSYAHTHGVVHRDIKPDNVLISGRHAVVTDFGVAKALSESTGESSLTSIGIALGTPAYMAPEQAAADPHVDHRADIYALGAMAYEMLTGKPPFGGSPQIVLAAHVTQPPEPVTSRRASVPPALATIVMRCLEKKAADRFQTAAELHQQFEIMATPSGGMAPTSATAAVSGVGEPTTARPAISMNIKLGVVVAAVAALIFAWRPWAAGDGELALDSRVVAVLPFRVAGADQSLHYLRQGMQDLLHAKLTGQGGPRAADVQSVVAAARAEGDEDADLSGESLLNVAKRVGAGFVIQGSIVGPPDRFVLQAALIEMPSGRQVAQTSLEGSKDSIFAMVNGLAQRLLALGGGASESQLTALTTTNFEAMRAYLDGQVAFRRGDYDLATQLLERAFALDSTFALGASALIEANGWAGVRATDMNRARRLAWQYRERLHETDRQFLIARLGASWPAFTPSYVDAQFREALVRQFPESPLAWYYLGDGYFHDGALSDVPDWHARARDAFSRSSELNPDFSAPLEHLTRLELLDGNVAAAESLAARLSAVNPNGYFAGWARVEIPLVRGDSMGAARALDERLRAGGLPGAASWMSWSASFAPFIANADSVLRAHDSPSLTRDQRTDLRLARMQLAVYQGRLEAARELAFAQEIPANQMNGIWAETAMMHLLNGDIAGAREHAAKVDPGFAAPPLVVLQLATGNKAGAAAMFADFRRRNEAILRNPGDDDYAHAVAALDALLATDANAPDALAKRLRADSLARGRGGRSDVISFIIAAAHERAGDPVRALVALNRTQRSLADEGGWGAAPRKLFEARLAATTGQRARAINAYETYLRMRTNPDPVFVPQRDSARAELAALQPRN